ncbi:hypothetical protein PInf_017310 [Phytophthora infestans]|nr:hypothetical protein PInf_017220 [Phytophthora infestans]KAI9991930.1 hypothetical protein PInf_017310 [Phytophthora infestans]
MDELGVPQESMRNYIYSLRLDSLPHGGGGIGLERVVMLYLGLGSITRHCALSVAAAIRSEPMEYGT